MLLYMQKGLIFFLVFVGLVHVPAVLAIDGPTDTGQGITVTVHANQVVRGGTTVVVHADQAQQQRAADPDAREAAKRRAATAGHVLPLRRTMAVSVLASAVSQSARNRYGKACTGEDAAVGAADARVEQPAPERQRRRGAGVRQLHGEHLGDAGAMLTGKDLPPCARERDEHPPQGAHRHSLAVALADQEGAVVLEVRGRNISDISIPFLRRCKRLSRSPVW